MQIIFENEVERNYSRRTGVVGSLIYVGRIHRYMERKCDGRVGIRGGGI